MQFVVTGGSSGVGAALVSRLTTSGHSVYNLDVQSPIDAASGSEFLQVDLSDPGAIAATLDQLPESLDGFANVAGIARSQNPALVITVNFLAPRLLTELLTPRIRRGGSVANVSSIAGWDWQARKDRIAPLLATSTFEEGLQWSNDNAEVLSRDPYTFSKRSLSAWCAQRAMHFKDNGVRINCISPGAIDTPLYPQFKELMGDAQSNWELEQVGRMASPMDIAQVLDMVLTSEVDWLNGADIPVDGGYMAGRAAGWIDFSESPVMKAIRAKREQS